MAGLAGKAARLLSMRAYAFVSEIGGDTNRAAAGRSVCNLVAMLAGCLEK